MIRLVPMPVSSWPDWLVAALLVPIPLAHLWLHALLRIWKRVPIVAYAIAIAVWFGAVRVAPRIDAFFPQVFVPSSGLRAVGFILMAIGALGPLASILTLGPRRFFVLAVLRPDPARDRRTVSGLFRFFPHPAYLGYVIVALGNLLVSGQLYLVGVLVLLLTTFPLVIWLEEEELYRRFGRDRDRS